MNKLHRQLTVLCIQHEGVWKRAYKEGKFFVGVQHSEDEYRVFLSWYDDNWARQQIVVKRLNDEGRAIKTMKEAKRFVYNILGEVIK